jgi:hypothetical protein
MQMRLTEDGTNVRRRRYPVGWIGCPLWFSDKDPIRRIETPAPPRTAGVFTFSDMHDPELRDAAGRAFFCSNAGRGRSYTSLGRRGF